VRAEQLAQPADDFTALRRRAHAPLLEPAQSSGYSRVILRAREGMDAPLEPSGRRIDRFQRLSTAVVGRGHTEAVQDCLRSFGRHRAAIVPQSNRGPISLRFTTPTGS
jgi:hypothetical protein